MTAPTPGARVRGSTTVISLNSPVFGEDVERLVLEVLRSGHVAQGPMVELFEGLCSAMAGTAHAVAMANGTVTLEACLEVLGIGPGDEVITSPLTFAATLNAILRSGATARFADVRPDGTIDPDATEALVGARTAVVMPVHLYGLAADMTAIADIARRRGIAVIEDAAQAHGATCNGRPVGGSGLGSFSFYATKNISAGEGGVVTTDDDGIAGGLRLLRNQGMAERYRYEIVGRNLRMTDLQAAVAIPALERLAEINRRRNDNAARLTSLLESTQLELPRVPSARSHVWHLYTVLLPDGIDRNGVVEGLAERGIQAGVFYPRLVWDYDAFRNLPQVVADHTPRAASMAARCMSLPVHHWLDRAEIDRVAEAVVEVLGAG